MEGESPLVSCMREFQRCTVSLEDAVKSSNNATGLDEIITMSILGTLAGAISTATIALARMGSKRISETKNIPPNDLRKSEHVLDHGDGQEPISWLPPSRQIWDAFWESTLINGAKQLKRKSDDGPLDPS